MELTHTLFFTNPCIRSIALLCLFALLPMQAAQAQSPSNFTTVKLPRGIELQIPKGWWLIGAEYNQAIQTSTEAVLELSGIGFAEGIETNLISANSMPRSTYAAVRVDSSIPPSVEPSEFASITAADIRELQTEIHQGLLKALPLQGNQLIDFLGSRVEKISGHPAIVTEYRRTSLKGSVFVQISQIFTASQEIRILLAYRESEAGLWLPVLSKIRQSIVVRR